MEQQELEQLFNEKKTEQLTFLLDQMLLQRFHKYESTVLECALRQILADPSALTIENLSQTLGISRRHLNRLFQTHFGVSVKKFCNIVAFRKAVTAKISENPHKSLTELAYEYGYADQAHLSKNIRAFTQKAPRLFFAQGKKLGNEDIFWHFNQ
ncbi:MAG: helix-turn-helix domain-containing protein [Leadbetterella sp.]|nr:helix-turn-helix domain-containing protein [Leadbetterella sp.]